MSPQLSLQTAHMPCDFPRAVVFATSTPGRFVKLKTYICSDNFQIYKYTEFDKTIIPFALVGYKSNHKNHNFLDCDWFKSFH